ncbi:hypothetical protein [Rhizobacter sp. OV335]|uniref:hypothetical protein n=1 Tax=Rhizobacter sp. OV335 TaxID=1500264 RepID=UPI00091A1244|nr:hypothetical protein [Rhizobacter sp. OV335]SHN27876.1 hypothetical protein SAMN02787076_04711 [Rhizobacter sp. OV335]
MMKCFSPIPRRYLFELGAAMLAYGLVLCSSIFLLKTGYFEGPSATLVALLPTLPCIAACWAILRQFRRLDELQMRVQLEALGFAFAGTALLTFSYGFLEGVGWRPLSMFTVWPLMAVLWVVGGLIAARRYR